eukprot:sb/3470548/
MVVPPPLKASYAELQDQLLKVSDLEKLTISLRHTYDAKIHRCKDQLVEQRQLIHNIERKKAKYFQICNENKNKISAVELLKNDISRTLLKQQKLEDEKNEERMEKSVCFRKLIDQIRSTLRKQHDATESARQEQLYLISEREKLEDRIFQTQQRSLKMRSEITALELQLASLKTECDDLNERLVDGMHKSLRALGMSNSASP